MDHKRRKPPVPVTRAFESRVLNEDELPPGAPVGIEIAPCSEQG
jgi:hypothetical protein